MRALGKVPALTSLYVYLDEIDDNHYDWVSDLGPLAGTALRTLHIDGCGVTDLAPLASLTELRVLSIEETSIRDLEPLCGLSSLVALFLNRCDQLTDFRPIASLPRLEPLDLSHAAPGLDLSPLAANPRLNVYIKPGQDVRGAEALGRRLKIS